MGTWVTTPGYNPIGEFTTEASYMGAKSLKVARTITSSRDFYSQQLNLTKGQTYTFSGYIKTDNISNTNGKGAALFINYEYASNQWDTVESMMVQGTTDWTRYEVKFTLPASAASDIVYARAGIVMETGTAYFDCFQMESGSLASRYNLVENADLSYTNPPVNNQVLPTVWIMNSDIETADTIEYKDGVNGFRVKGVTSKQKYMSQLINVSGKAGDTLIMSALGKSGSVPLDKKIDARRRFSIELGLRKPGYTYDTEWHIVYFNEDAIDWQYISDVVVAQSDYISATIYAEYYYNANYSYFTQFGLYKDEFGTSYTYDDKGNVIRIDDLAKQKSTFEYNLNNDLSKATMPSNGVFNYEYSNDTRRNLTKATSATNVVYTFSYDSSGNPLKSRVGDTSDVTGSTAKLFMESTGSYSISGNYLKALIDNEENSVISHYDEVKGLLIGTTDGKGNKTLYEYDNMDRIVSVSKRLEDVGGKRIENFPLATSTIGTKGTKPLVGDPSLIRSLGSDIIFQDLDNEWRLEDWNNSTGLWRRVQDTQYENLSLECYALESRINRSEANPVAYQLITLRDTLTEEKQFTLNMNTKKTGMTNPEVGIQCFNKNGGQIEDAYEIYEKIIPENEWVKISQTFTVPAGAKSFFVILGGHISGSDRIRFNSVNIEARGISTLSSYASGSRSSAKYLYDLGLDKKSGTMAVWFNTTGTGTRMIFSNETNGVIFNLYIGSDNKIILNSLTQAGITQNIITVNDISIANNRWYFVALKWSMSQESSTTSALNCTLYINDSNIYTGKVFDFRDFTGVITAIGTNVFGNYNLTGTVDNFSYSRNALSDADIKLLYGNKIPADKGTTVTNSYTYENDRIKTVSHNEFSYTFGYDSLGNNNKVLVGSQELITNIFEASTGNLMNSVYGNHQRVSMDYDRLDRVTARKFNKDVTDTNATDEIRYTYEYDAEGNLGYHEDNVNKKGYRYTYDLAERLAKIDEINNDSSSANYKNINYTQFGYDSSNNQSIITENIDKKVFETRYAFDKDTKPTGVFYDPAVEDNTNFEYFHLSENTTGSKGTVPETQTPVFVKDVKGEGALYAYPNTKVIYNLGINKNSGTMTVWMNTANNTGSRMIIGNEGTGNLLNVYIDKDQKVNLAVINSAGTFTNVITTEEAIDYNVWYFIAVKWQYNSGNSNLTCTLYLNSTKYEKVVASSGFKDFTGAKTAIGSNISGVYPLNGLIRKFNYSPYALPENEILSMYVNKSTRYLYDKLGRVTNKTINIGRISFATQYNYVTVTGKEQGATINKLSSIQNGNVPISYYYDANGNIIRILDNGKENLYYYNELNELIREDNGALNKTIIYTYDGGGNIRTKEERVYKSESSVLPTATYDYFDDWKDKLHFYNGKEITYDEIGNPKTYDGYTYSWEEGRRLVSIAGNGKNISFKYNDSGIRTEKNAGGVVTKYHLIGDRVTYEYTEDANHVRIDTIYYRYDHANDLVGMNLNGVEYYYIRNGQGDIIGLLDSNGLQVVSYVYDSWGKVVSIGGTLKDTLGVKNPYRYRGYRYEKDTESQSGKGDGLYYLNSRYYNPEWCRYLNADALGGNRGELLSHNVFAYAKNDPANLEDPSGSLSILGRLWEATKSTINKVEEIIGKVSQFLTPSTQTKIAIAMGAGIAIYKIFKPLKVSAKSKSNIVKETTKVRHYTNRKGIKGIEDEMIIRAKDNNRVYVELANKKAFNQIEAETKYQLKPGKGRDYVEFDVQNSILEWIKNPRYGTEELTIKGDINLMNPQFFRRK